MIIGGYERDLEEESVTKLACVNYSVVTYLDLGVVGNCGLAILCRDCNFEHTEVVLGHGRCVTVPAIEIADEVCSQCIWRPFAVYNITVVLDDEAELLVALEKRSELTFGG